MNATGFDTFGFVAEEADALNIYFERGKIGLSIVGGGLIFLKEISSDDVNLFVGALSGEDGGDEEFEWIGEVQLAMRIRVGVAQFRDDAVGTILSGGAGFPRHAMGEVTPGKGSGKKKGAW